MRRRLRLALAACALVLAAGPAAADLAVRGVSITSWGWDHYGDADAPEVLAWARCLGATDVALVTEIPVDTGADRMAPPGPTTGPNANLARMAAEARRQGLRVTIKPHHLNGETGGHLAHPAYAPADPAAFFAAYRESLLAHARIAAAAGAERLVVGTELGGQLTGAAMRPHWERLIAELRTVFPGRLTYAATTSTDWPDSPGANEAQFLAFWDLLDEIGLNVYPTLSTAPAPAAPQLAAAFRRNPKGADVVGPLQALAARWGRPALILETGFRSLAGGLSDSGDWRREGAPDPALQAAALEASLAVWSREPWLSGLFLWEVEAVPELRRGETGFSFRGKPAEAAVRRWFAAGGVPAGC
ncbi:MAG TPA: hypothetical protein VEH84_07485 [Alphaproteobacteria bacterium]|nr:hypothetical protein [Alphaproteobacteria bacterium]